MKSYTDLKQSKVLAKILPLESADMSWILVNYGDEAGSKHEPSLATYKTGSFFRDRIFPKDHTIPCWSLAALLNILHSKAKNIPSLSGGGYRDGEYISDWCLDYEFEDGDYQKTFADNSIDACYEMVIHLNELNLL